MPTSSDFLSQKTVRGFVLAECMSALQKAIRRCDERAAVCWAVEMDQSGHGKMLWNRLLIICSEDIGLAEPHLPAQIRALYENWNDLAGKPAIPNRLFTLHAVMLMARARKSRRVDNAIWASYAVEEPLLDEIPDYALDYHTKRGRQMGSKMGDQSGYEVENEADLGHNFWNERKLEYRQRVGRSRSNEWFKTQWNRNQRDTPAPAPPPDDPALF